MNETTSRIYREWLRRIDARVATTGQIRQFAQVGNGGGKATNLTTDEWNDICHRLRYHPVGLPDRDRDAGCTWLRRNGAKRLGLDPAVIESVVDFRFDGEVVAYSNRVAVPVWIGLDADGAHVLRYYAVSWQGVAYPGGEGGPYIDAERVWLPRVTA